MSQVNNATLARRLADDGQLITAASQAANGERFYMVSIGLQETHLLHSGTFRADGQDGEGLCVQFDGELNVRSKSADVLGIGPLGSQRVCMRSLDALGDDYVDLRPRTERALL
jgi:hypothetical protein